MKVRKTGTLFVEIRLVEWFLRLRVSLAEIFNNFFGWLVPGERRSLVTVLQNYQATGNCTTRPDFILL